MERRGNTDGTVSLRLAEYRQDLQEFPLFPPPVEKADLPKKDAGLEMVFPYSARFPGIPISHQ